jgi:hypothetical protein
MPDLFQQLSDNGYNPYSMPDRDFVPLAVLLQGKEKTFERMGMLPQFVEFPPHTPRPADPVALPPEAKAGFNSLFTSRIDASIGAGILKNIFSALAMTDISTKINFKRVNKVELSFNNVISDTVDPVEIAAYLDKGKPVRPGLTAGQLVPKKTFVAYDTLKSDSFTIKCHADEKADAVTEVNVLKNVLSANSKIKITEKTDTSISFSGPGFQTFAFRMWAFWIVTKAGRRSFLFQKDPPGWLEDIFGIAKGPSRGGGTAGAAQPKQPAGRMVGDSFVLPTGTFFRFD